MLVLVTSRLSRWSLSTTYSAVINSPVPSQQTWSGLCDTSMRCSTGWWPSCASVKTWWNEPSCSRSSSRLPQCKSYCSYWRSVSPSLWSRLKYLNICSMCCNKVLFKLLWSQKINIDYNDPLTFFVAPLWRLHHFSKMSQQDLNGWPWNLLQTLMFSSNMFVITCQSFSFPNTSWPYQES